MNTSLKIIHTNSQVNHVFKEGTTSLGHSDMAEKNPICNLTVVVQSQLVQVHCQ